MHKWWARRLGVNFRFLLLGATSSSNTHEKTIMRRFFQPNSKLNLTVLDPFMGGGTSIVEATKLGAKTIGVDLDPLAWFIVSKQIGHFNEVEFMADLDLVQLDVADQIRKYYKTQINGKSANVVYYFWVEIIPCELCGNEFEGHMHYLLYSKKKKGDSKDLHGIGFCHNCYKLHELNNGEEVINCTCGEQTVVEKGNLQLGKYICPKCHHEAKISDISPEHLPLKQKLFAIEYVDPDTGERAYKTADGTDLMLYEQACRDLEQCWNELPIPDQNIPTEGRFDPRPVSLGYKKYRDLFNRRQLLCLALLLKRLKEVKNTANRELLLLAFSDALACNNLFCSYAFGYQKLTPLFGLHAFRRISRPVEGNVWGTTIGRGSFSSCVEKVIRGKRFSVRTFEYNYNSDNPDDCKRIETDECAQATIVNDVKSLSSSDRQSSYLTIADSRNLSWIPPQSVDIVLTDPPYYNNLAYSEMADFYYVWLKDNVNWAEKETQHSPMNDSLLVRKGTEEEHQRYTVGLTSAFVGCRKAIKQDGIMVFTYHHNNCKAWESLTLALRHGDFRVTNCFPLLAEGKSGFHSDSGNIKWDMVFVCRPGIKTNVPKYSNKRAKNWLEDRRDELEAEANNGGASFSEADKRSLAFGLMTSYLTRYNVSDEEISEIFKKIREDFSSK